MISLCLLIILLSLSIVLSFYNKKSYHKIFKHINVFQQDRQIVKELNNINDLYSNNNDNNKHENKKNSIVIIAGFESFNKQLYNQAAIAAKTQIPDVPIKIFTDTDIETNPNDVDEALKNAGVLLCSLIFDYNQVQFIRDKVLKYDVPVRFCFESALELMSETKVGEFTMGGGQAAGPPPAVKALLSQFGSKKEEDRMVGYINFLKVGPKLLQYVPGNKAKDLKNWLTVYSYWNQGSIKNIVSMLYQISDTFQLSPVKDTVIEEVIDNPALGIYHPRLDKFMDSPKEYVEWYTKRNTWVNEDTPRVGILLYRKHVLSDQQYLGNLIKLMETENILPIPVYINGVEAHTVVRDLFTTDSEQSSRIKYDWSLSDKATKVDFIINTIGFPLVGGPAGSMEGGRKIELSSEILQAKNVPYVVAAPLIIQDTMSWEKNGVQGLQQVVLYSLPELDGAIETQVLGGLVGGDQIIVIPERVRKLTSRIKAWHRLRKTNNSDKRVSLIVYGFPPNVGAVGTAALLNVAASIKSLLNRLSKEGYNVGSDEFLSSFDHGDKLINALRILSQDYINVGSVERAKEAIRSGTGLKDFDVVMEDVDFRTLKSWLGKNMIAKMEKNWGDLERYSGISSSGTGKLRVSSLRIGNILISIQPLLGLEGDPMRLLFERDLTPHPQYGAFYQWLQRDYDPHVVLHFGMHGTFEWLPGSSLGSTAESWPEIMIGSVPNLYLYAVNNPSESLLAKRRGFATLITHNIPPYSRSGLYKELSAIRELILDYRTEASKAGSVSGTKVGSLSDIIIAIFTTLDRAGLYQDIGTEELTEYMSNGKTNVITVDDISNFLNANTNTNNDNDINRFLESFSKYISRVSQYLMDIENRLFSDGLHVIGDELTEDQLVGYLDAVLDNTNTNTNTNDNTNHNKLDHDILRLIAKKSLEGSSSSSSILLEARSHANTNTNINTNTHHDKAAIFANILTEEDHFSLSLLKTSVKSFFEFRSLLFQRDYLNDDNANEHIDDFIANHWIHDSNTNTKSLPIANDAVKLALSLAKNPSLEMQSLVSGLAGDYIAAGPGGDLVRDGIAILPTGRNMYSLDPYRIPSPVAMMRGKEAAEAILVAHQNKNDGSYPETVAVTLWGLDIIKTKGESLGIVLAMVGATPIREGTGRIVDFELIPLEKLGRPRIDVLCSLSGIFRDSFGNIIDLLDSLFEKASIANEPINMNFIKKHSEAIEGENIDRSTSRLFSNPSGEFGSMVNEKIGSGDWNDEGELGTTWEARNSFSYGRKGEKGAARPELLKALLNTTDRIIQEIDSVEYGLTDIQEYYANTGAIKKAITNTNKSKKVDISIVEAFDKKVNPKEVEEVLRLEYRSKLLNPKWSESMLKQGAAGAYEISGRMTAVLGWAATVDFKDQYIYNSITEKYILDEKMANRLKALNPEAFRNLLKRSLELSGRGYWQADEDTLNKINEMYAEVEDEIEGV